MEEYRYEPLNLERPAIRLLRLHCGLVNEISCELFQAELHRREDSVSYEALSYTWGSPNRTESIIVNGYRMKITHNLYAALLHLLIEDEDRVLWIDAVCIDQANMKERGHQVAQMGDIYKGADRVIFRLGQGSDETDVFMESLQFLQQTSMGLACRAWSPQDVRWKDLWACFRPRLQLHTDIEKLQRRGLEAILGHSWFRRVWILQEAAFAKAGIISCGTKSVSARLFGITPFLLGIEPEAHCQSVIDILPSPWRERSWWSQTRSIYTLLRAFGGSQASEDRDLVYALRGMSSDLSDASELVPDYEKPERDVLRDVFRVIYTCELECLKPSLRPRSVRDLIRRLQSAGGDKNLLGLMESSVTRNNVEEIFKNRKDISVNKKVLNTAARHDRTGEVVELLLRHRGEELKIDKEVFVHAAGNVTGAREVLGILSRHQSQVFVPKRALIAAAMNWGCGDVAMDILLSLKTEDYSIASIANAITRNTSRNMRTKTARMLMRLNGEDGATATASAILTEFANRRDPRRQLKELFEDFPDYPIVPEAAIIAALENKSNGQRCLDIFLRYCPSKITLTKDILRTVARSVNGADTMRLLLENPDVQNPLSQQEQFAVLAPFTNPPLINFLLQHHGGGILSSEAVDAASGDCYRAKSILGVLIRESTYEVKVNKDAMVSLLKAFGKAVVQDLFQFRRQQSMNDEPFVRQFLSLLREEEEMRRKWEKPSAGQLTPEDEEQAGRSPIQPVEARHLLQVEERVCVPLLLKLLAEPMTDEERLIWMPLVGPILHEYVPDQVERVLKAINVRALARPSSEGRSA